VRAEIVAAARERSGWFPPGSPFTVLALGGSQGARAINSRVVEMARRAKRDGRAMRFLLQAGEKEHGAVAEAVRAEGLPVEAFPFTERIGDMFPRCHAVLMRAGALSIAEAALFGRPCVLIPYPYAADGHQARNAEEFCAAGAGSWLPEGEATVEAVWDALWALGGDREARERAAAAALSFGRPQAADDSVRRALRLAGRA
jgi:UDP-N-acetylglucosamine--N-acetylmuramyl-(pentapeptide) pyrophosphoryl-undecaprenol N-acetylglucosamine transferase